MLDRLLKRLTMRAREEQGHGQREEENFKGDGAHAHGGTIARGERRPVASASEGTVNRWTTVRCSNLDRNSCRVVCSNCVAMVPFMLVGVGSVCFCFCFSPCQLFCDIVSPVVQFRSDQHQLDETLRRSRKTRQVPNDTKGNEAEEWTMGGC